MGGGEPSNSLTFSEQRFDECKIENGKWKVFKFFPLRPERMFSVIFKSEAFGDPAFCKSSKRYDKLDSRASHENDKRISSPTGEGATHVNIFQNYCKITKNKCVARWGLARKGGVICYQ